MYIKLPIPDAGLRPKFTCVYTRNASLTHPTRRIAVPRVERELSDRKNGSGRPPAEGGKFLLANSRYSHAHVALIIEIVPRMSFCYPLIASESPDSPARGTRNPLSRIGSNRSARYIDPPLATSEEKMPPFLGDDESGELKGTAAPRRAPSHPPIPGEERIIRDALRYAPRARRYVLVNSSSSSASASAANSSGVFFFRIRGLGSSCGISCTSSRFFMLYCKLKKNATSSRGKTAEASRVSIEVRSKRGIDRVYFALVPLSEISLCRLIYAIYNRQRAHYYWRFVPSWRTISSIATLQSRTCQPSYKYIVALRCTRCYYHCPRSTLIVIVLLIKASLIIAAFQRNDSLTTHNVTRSLPSPRFLPAFCGDETRGMFAMFIVAMLIVNPPSLLPSL